MKRFVLIAAVAVAMVCLTTNSWARLPKPVKEPGAVRCLDVESKTVCFKPNQPGAKLMVLDWNEETRFLVNGQSVKAGDLKLPANVVITYRRLSFRNPLLKEVAVTDSSSTGARR